MLGSTIDVEGLSCKVSEISLDPENFRVKSSSNFEVEFDKF